MAAADVCFGVPMQPAALVACTLAQLESRCRERGYTLDDARPCVVSQNGDRLVVDTEHPAYPHARGPGQELKKLLRRLGIHASPSCPCPRRAAQMNAKGCQWCEDNLDQIVGWLREEATKRGLPFIDVAGRVLVRRAIANARRAEAGRAKETEQAKGSAV